MESQYIVGNTRQGDTRNNQVGIGGTIYGRDSLDSTLNHHEQVASQGQPILGPDFEGMMPLTIFIFSLCFISYILILTFSNISVERHFAD